MLFAACGNNSLGQIGGNGTGQPPNPPPNRTDIKFPAQQQKKQISSKDQLQGTRALEHRGPGLQGRVSPSLVRVLYFKLM